MNPPDDLAADDSQVDTVENPVLDRPDASLPLGAGLRNQVQWKEEGQAGMGRKPVHMRWQALRRQTPKETQGGTRTSSDAKAWKPLAANMDLNMLNNV
ncbi:hypothetical protein PSTT_15952 [Puccinia striiformis]|uniref:Uncharacterized protein n=1 Tax=Puccinia striiformis TaxID=27350 RepID=A0A2S4UFI5_9BASI|nr:hypothetical protein PSTT_15952 [Puccinia striiformis]